MSDADLREWADGFVELGYAPARAVLRLIAERDDARRVAESLAERVFAQSELLSRRSERTDTRP